jgi:hypothetical protein
MMKCAAMVKCPAHGWHDCPAEPVATAVFGCRHEHVDRLYLCAAHLAKAKDECPACGLCLGLGHECILNVHDIRMIELEQA